MGEGSSMFSDSELTFARAYIDTYGSQGYAYYVVQTVSEYNNPVDLRFFFSKTPISFSTQTTFDILDGVRVDYDSSNSYNDSSLVKFKCYSVDGSVSIAGHEDIYSNALPVSASLAAYPSFDCSLFELKSGVLIFGFLISVILFSLFVSNWFRGR